MKSNVHRPWLMAACMLVLAPLHAQVTVPSNQISNPGDFVGWDNTVTNDPLMIKHEANQPIDWYTRAIHRMRLNPNASYHIGSVLFGTQNASGFLGISPNNSLWNPVNSPGPFTRLHLHDGSSFVQQTGYRPQMRNGITLTGNSDQSYIGHKFAGDDNTDFVIQWSDKQRLRRPRPKAVVLDRGSMTDTHC